MTEEIWTYGVSLESFRGTQAIFFVRIITSPQNTEYYDVIIDIVFTEVIRR